MRTAVFITLFLGLTAVDCGAQDTVDLDKSVKQILAEINARYDDFFRYRRYTEEHLASLQRGVRERKDLERRRARELEKARVDYVNRRRVKPSDEALEARWEKERKERAERLELLRRRYVERRDTIEDYEKKGRQIPGMQEFGLDEQ